MRVPRLILTLVAVCVLAGAGCTALDRKQRQWIFQPSDRLWPSANMSGMQDVWVALPTAADRSGDMQQPARLHGLWMPQTNTRAPLLLYLHGARWNVSGSTARIRRMHELGFSVLAIDYRGFGRSSPGLPSQASAAEDALAAWQWLGQQASKSQHQPPVARYIFGHSLGGAIAIGLAHQVQDEAGVMVEGSFTRIADVVRSFRWGWLPVGPLITQRFDALSQVADIGAPLLVVHGGQDRLIDPALGRQLFDAARSPKQFVLVPEGSHHNTQALAMAQYRQALKDLFGLPARQKPAAKTRPNGLANRPG